MRQEGIRLDLGATVRLDITLKIGTLAGDADGLGRSAGGGCDGDVREYAVHA